MWRRQSRSPLCEFTSSAPLVVWSSTKLSQGALIIHCSTSSTDLFLLLKWFATSSLLSAHNVDLSFWLNSSCILLLIEVDKLIVQSVFQANRESYLSTNYLNYLSTIPFHSFSAPIPLMHFLKMKNPYHSQFKPTFPFMATDWRWCWTPKRLKVHLPTFTTGFVLLSIKIVCYQHLLVSFEGLLSLQLSDHFALVVGCINNNWLNLWKKDAYKVFTGISPPLRVIFPSCLVTYSQIHQQLTSPVTILTTPREFLYANFTVLITPLNCNVMSWYTVQSLALVNIRP